MQTLTSKEAKQKFGVVMDNAKTQDITITKHSRPAVVVISIERYNHLSELEDQYWIAKAEEGERSGYMGVEESEAFLKRMMNA